jgi:hypothetical protein
MFIANSHRKMRLLLVVSLDFLNINVSGQLVLSDADSSVDLQRRGTSGNLFKKASSSDSEVCDFLHLIARSKPKPDISPDLCVKPKKRSRLSVDPTATLRDAAGVSGVFHSYRAREASRCQWAGMLITEVGPARVAGDNSYDLR